MARRCLIVIWILQRANAARRVLARGQKVASNYVLVFSLDLLASMNAFRSSACERSLVHCSR